GEGNGHDCEDEPGPPHGGAPAFQPLATTARRDAPPPLCWPRDGIEARQTADAGYPADRLRCGRPWTEDCQTTPVSDLPCEGGCARDALERGARLPPSPGRSQAYRRRPARTWRPARSRPRPGRPPRRSSGTSVSDSA